LADLLLFMEMNGAQTWMVHVCGMLLIAGRLMHYYGFHHRLIPLASFRHERDVVFVVADGAGELWYMPWELVFSVR
jgi:uncharacterized membrane protein YecN with MAPEG domain